MKRVADTGGSTSARQRSFLGHSEAMPANRRLPPPSSVEDIGSYVTIANGKFSGCLSAMRRNDMRCIAFNELVAQDRIGRPGHRFSI
jgi:hypothetical protein